MNSSPTHNSRTLSSSLERWWRAPVALCVWALVTVTAAHAHGEADDPLPAEPGLSWDAALALRALDADGTLPSTRLGGYLLQGDAGMDPQGTELEHGAAGLAVRLDEQWGGRLVLGKHEGEAAEFEEAWLQYRRDVDNGDAWLLQAGRQRPAMGPVLAAAGHFDRFGLMPLAQRVALDHDWVDDGLQLGWRRDAGPSGQWALDVGLWRGQGFPGADGASAAPSLHLGWLREAWRADVLWARFRPQGRGAAIGTTTTHSHGAPVCDASLSEVICFSGHTDLWAGSARWDGQAAAAPLPLTLSAAGWLRNDSGTLESANGLADYRGRNRGYWLDAIWHLKPALELGWRGERLSASHELRGAGASLLAADAGLDAYAPVTRQTLMAGYRFSDAVQLRVEYGSESQSGARTAFAAVRLLLQTGSVRPH